jgi:hypothetical protein
MRSKNTRLCRCGVGTILTGVQRSHNAKSEDGTDICADCKLEELYATYLDKRSGR